eukprot:COSAG05_NODE_20572_length_278_cov_0.854749_1_plen_35_part_01
MEVCELASALWKALNKVSILSEAVSAGALLITAAF